MRDDQHYSFGTGSDRPTAGFRLPPDTFPPGHVEPDLPTGNLGDPPPPPRRESPPLPVTNSVPAGFFRRAAAFVTDLLLVEFMAGLLGTMSAMGRLLSQGMDSSFAEIAANSAMLFGSQVFPLLLFCYFFFFYAYGGRTPGKMVFGLVVETAQGQPLSWGRALARTLGYLASMLLWGLGFLLAAGPDKKALHDRLVGTRVVIRPPWGVDPGQ